MSLYRQTVSGIIKKWPGEKTFGIYRFLPLFFVLGAALEFSMINWTVGTTNFCKRILFLFVLLKTITPLCTDTTFKKRQAKEIVENQLHQRQ